MYVSDLVWYQKQVRKKALLKRSMIWMMRGGLCILLIAVMFHLPWDRLFVDDNREEIVEASVAEDIKVTEDAESNEIYDDIMNSADMLNMTEEIVVQKEAPIIILDPGHGGMDEGGSSNGTEEKDINLRLALSLKDKLVEYGFTVILTRETDSEVSLTDRAELARKMQGDLLISIHQNTCEYEEVSGIEIWYEKTSRKENERLARLMQQHLVANTGAMDRGIMETDTLYVIRECGMPACLVETGFLSNTDECRLLTEEKYCDKLVQGMADAVWYYFYPKKMYLTFDDGPSRENTERILDVLKERNIKATFFVVGENAKKYPELIKRISEEGHVIGIHCYSHSYDKIYAGVQDYVDDFEQARKLIYEITGEEVWCYRFPGGSINKHNKHIYNEIIEKMTELGYVYYDWNGCFEDAVSNPNREQIIKSAVESTLKRKKVIMLAHDTVDETAACLAEVLDALPEYEFLPLTKDVEPIQFK